MSTRLPSSELGRTGMRISRVGIGAWAFGGPGWVDTWGTQDDRESIEAIRHAVDSGVNWIDTAPIYGAGHAEEVVGQALRSMPESDRPYVFTKAGVVWDPDRPTDDPRLVGTPQSIRAEVEASLRRLGIERIDLYQMHAPPAETRVEAYWQTFCELRDEGKVRAVGLSNHSVSQLDAAASVGAVDSVQPRLNLLDRSAADVVAWAEANSAGSIVYSPMASGLLTGTFSVARLAALPADDWRRGHPDFVGDALRRSLAVADGLRPAARRHGVSPAAIAVAWTLAFPGVTGAIVGVRSGVQVDGWLAAASLELDDADLDELASVIERAGAGSGPIRPGAGASNPI